MIKSKSSLLSIHFFVSTPSILSTLEYYGLFIIILYAEKKLIMVLSIVTRQHIEEKLGKTIRYPSDYEQLAYDIERATKQRISTNTIKRLLGAIESVREPRLYTLDVIAAYLGFENWDVYVVSLSKEGNSQFEKSDAVDGDICQEVAVANLKEGIKVEFQYYPDRKIVLEHLAGKEFRVVGSSNSKLRLGDVVEVSNFYLNYPLIINRVMRDGLNVGRFTAGKISGLTYLKLLE